MSGKRNFTHNFSITYRDTNLQSRALRIPMLLSSMVMFGAAALVAHPAAAQTIQLGDYSVTLQSTLGYNLGLRTAPVDNETATLNNDDGDRNFRSGIMQDRFSTLEQLNITNGQYGLRASAQAFLDLPYLQNNKNNSPNTFNAYNVGPQGFPSETIADEGRKLNILAIFLYGQESFDNGNQRLSWQLGRQTITWGEALFSLNGIAGLQAPVDFYQAESVPNPTAQSLFLPTGAVSLSYDVGNGMTLDSYWQFEYEPDILPGIGSYFSESDAVGPGGQRILASTIDEGALSLYRAPDIRPSNGLNQFGFAVHDTLGNYQIGAYFVRGIPKSPGVYTNAPSGLVPGPQGSGFEVGRYNIVYQQPVNAIALSASTDFGNANVAGEISDRFNQPLLSEPAYTSANPANYDDPLYAVGNVMNGTLSGIYVTAALPLMPNGASIETEATLSDVLSVTDRKAALVPDNTNIGGDYELVVTPNWFPRTDIEVELPIGWTTTFLGDSKFEGTAAGTSTYDIGLKAVYRNNLTVGLNYQRYAGPPNRQGLLDRDYATFYIQRTF